MPPPPWGCVASGSSDLVDKTIPFMLTRWQICIACCQTCIQSIPLQLKELQQWKKEVEKEEEFFL